jgi:hypothetical protein
VGRGVRVGVGMVRLGPERRVGGVRDLRRLLCAAYFRLGLFAFDFG